MRYKLYDEITDESGLTWYVCDIQVKMSFGTMRETYQFKPTYPRLPDKFELQAIERKQQIQNKRGKTTMRKALDKVKTFLNTATVTINTTCDSHLFGMASGVLMIIASCAVLTLSVLIWLGILFPVV